MDAARVGRFALNAMFVVVIVVALVGLAMPLLLGWLISRPPTPDRWVAEGLGEQARGIAYALRTGDVRGELDRGASMERVAALTSTTTMSAAELAATDAQHLSQRVVLTGVERVGDTGVAVQVATGGVFVSGGGWWYSQDNPWVECLRIELPATAIDATEWSVQDATCPTFDATLRQGYRIHAGDFDVKPLLRPPCYGTTGYCPGG